MKKLIATVVCAAALAGCNRSILDWQWSFNRALVRMPDGSCREYKVKHWRDFENSDMIQFETDTEVLCTHSANVILIKVK